ncbi:S8 family serine peptidase [Virgibacillus kimchii]
MKKIHKKKWEKNLSIFLVLLMTLSLVFPAGSLAKDSTTAGKHQQKQGDTKVDAALLEAFEKEEHVPFIVILKEQTDTEEIAQHAKDSAAKQSLSADETKGRVQEAVVSELQNNAEMTQKNIISYLDNHGSIKDYQSFYIVNALAVTGTEKTAHEIASRPEVKSVILDKNEKLTPIENKSFENSGIEWNIDRVGAPEVWEDDVTGEGVVIANLDSGVSWQHPALKRQYRGFDPDDPDNASHEFNWHDAVLGANSPMDSDGHGTHTMGTMVGQEEDGANQIGVAPGAEWIAVRAFYGGSGYDHHILEAAEWVLAPTDEYGVPHPDKAPDIVNNSWGGRPVNNDWFLPMVQAWRAAGIVPVFSVGNAGLFDDPVPGSAAAPGNYEESIAVGATDEDDILAEFSLRGPSEMGVLKPDLAAPGVNIRSSTRDDSYTENNGTSMAAPHVAATISLMLEVDPDLTIEQIEDVLKLTAAERTDEDYPDSPNNGYGYGLLDAAAAVEAVQEGIGTIDGQVTAPGIDDEAPTYEHDPRESLYKNKDEEFLIRASDNVSVNEVTLTLTLDNGTEKSFEAEAVEGDHLDGVYEAVVPKDEIIGDTLDYRWSIHDFNGNETVTDVYTVSIEEGVGEGYIEDFEGYPDGWYSFGRNNSWEWGIPTYGPDGAPSGEKVAGTNLRGLYAMDADMTLMMPPVFVEEDTVLRFKNWYKLTLLGQDTGTVFVSTDGESWDPLYQVRQENTRWHEIGLDLSDYAGEQVYIAFNLESSSNENDGWYIDDVKVVNDSSGVSIANQVYDENATLNIPEEQVNDKLQPMLEFNGVEKESENTREGNEAFNEGIIPVEATIKVEETGWETETDLRDGSFAVHHKPGEYTLHVDAYGYEQETVAVSLTEKETISPEIQMTPLPRQSISGTVESTMGQEIEDATVFLLEDENSGRISTNEDGTYQLEAIEGTYSLKAYADGYYAKTEEITVVEGEDLQLDITLEPFYEAGDSEIAYDSGSYARNLAFSKKGSGFAVRMSLEEGGSSAMLTGAKLQFWADHVPQPGGTDIMIAVYDANGENGAPGNKLAGPVEATAVRDLDTWTEVDLTHLGVVVEDDFYIVYLQADDYPYIPGFVADGESNNYADRSWQYAGGQWTKSDGGSGNFMIRANVDYGEEPEYVAPEITAPEDGLITNEEEIVVEGTGNPNTAVHITSDSNTVGTGIADENGEFSINATLEEGANELQAITFVDDEPVAESNVVSVVLDTLAPELRIESPEEGETLTETFVMVEGTVEDQHLDRVEVEGMEADVDDSGHYSREISLGPGEQTIEVTAYDAAGNFAHNHVTVFVETEEEEEGPVIENVTPEENIYLSTGESVKITFDSEPGLRSTFQIYLPLAESFSQISGPGPIELPMMEIENGKYVGYWTVPTNLTAAGAQIQVKGVDQAGNEATELADGRLFINVEEEQDEQASLFLNRLK